MELKEFIEQTLKDIAQGVHDGALATKDLGAIVNRRRLFVSENSRAEVTVIEFTIGLSATDSNSKTGGGASASSREFLPSVAKASPQQRRAQ